MQKLIIIKLGGSVITDKSKVFTARETVIQRLGREIKKSRESVNHKIIITHGSGSFGHSVAKKYQTQIGFKDKGSLLGMSKTSDAATDINKIVVKNLIKAGLNVKSFSPASMIFSDDQKINSSFTKPVEQALGLGIVPVLYGDVVMDRKMGFCIYSAEKVIKVLVKKLHKLYKIEKIIYCTDTDGVYDNEGKTIPLINSKNFPQVKKMIGSSKSTDVTGGMIHKVQESVELSKKYKIEIYLENGKKKQVLCYSLLKNNNTSNLTRIKAY